MTEELSIGVVTEADNPIRKWLLYGQSGSGKTYMAGTFPKPLFVDVEGGLASLQPLIREGANRILRLPSDHQIASYGEYLDCIDVAAEALKTGSAPFESLVIDSINQVQYLMVQDILVNYDKNRPYDDQLTRDDYGKLARMMEQHLASLLSLNCNIVLICGTQQQNDQQQIWPAMLGSKAVPAMLRLCDAVGFCWSEHIAAVGQTPEQQLYQVSFTNCQDWVAKIRGYEFAFQLPNLFPFQ